MHHPLHITPAMLAFLLSIEHGPSVRSRANHLYLALLHEGLDVRYNDNMSEYWRPHGSKTGSAVFDEIGADGLRFATSLEYTLLFVALARELGLTVSAARRDKASTSLLSTSIVASVRDGTTWYCIDLASQQFYTSMAGFQLLSDAELEATHYQRCRDILQRQRRWDMAADRAAVA